MSLNKSITQGKEHRKPYQGAKGIERIEKMTIKELYEEAVEKGMEDYEIRLQYQDGGGCYCGSCYLSETEYDGLREEVLLS